MANRTLGFFLLIFAWVPATRALGVLSDDKLRLLQDPGGWEYITVSDADNGIQTQHTCFNGRPHPEECSGTLSLTSGHTFVQNVYIHGQRVQRHGTYRLNGTEFTLFDELGTKDGPYTININTQAKSLILDMPQAHIKLMLEKEYRRRMQK